MLNSISLAVCLSKYSAHACLYTSLTCGKVEHKCNAISSALYIQSLIKCLEMVLSVRQINVSFAAKVNTNAILPVSYP